VTPEARAARERKQKIFVAVGGIFMVIVLVFFTLPKVLGGGSSSSEAAATETTSTVPGQVSTTPTSTAAPAGAATTDPAAQASTVAATTKLSSFDAFRPKDPFVQQVVTPNGIQDAGAPAQPGDGGKAAKGSKSEGSTEKFSVGTKAAETSTIVTVNGARQVVAPGARFPAADPLFVLVAEKPEAKAIVIGVVGGAYSGGDRTTTLKVGKSLTLVNTTTGARYKIALVSVGSGDQTEQPPAQK
jgi:hypothetical protein